MDKIQLPTTHWKLSESNTGIQTLFVKEFGIHSILSQVLTCRNLLSLDDAKRYLNPSLKDLYSPFMMKDMHLAVDRVIRAISNKEKMVIYGDYDADGVTSVVVLLKFLKDINQSVTYYIPDRILEGYGLNKNAIDRMQGNNVSLIITVDCGISDHDEINYARSLGIDVIILDHHEVSTSIPNAIAVINPKQNGCPYPYKHLAAVGIAFNFLIALRGNLREDGFWKNQKYPNLKEYLDLVALGTIGDISPLTDQNRIYTKIGLDLITKSKRIGIMALKEICGISTAVIDSSMASFCLIPRINAAGRVATSKEAVNLLMSDNISEAREIAQNLDSYNRKRQNIEKNILHEILKQIEENHDPQRTGSFVFASDKWHPGVIGIVASRLVDKYGRPAILISLKNGIGKGSGRSVAAFNIFRGLQKCHDLLISYGGHQYAAGILIKEEDIERFRELLEEIVQENLKISDFVSQTTIEAQCKLSDLNEEILSQLDKLAPFGSANPEPTLCVRNVNISDSCVVGNNHLKMRVNADGVSCNSIWFSKGHLLDLLIGSSCLDIAFTPQLNHWNGFSRIQLKMRDVAIQDSVK
jgi:single-stranded-DNA-specific exonuclease